jgi:hypothetical protein
MPHLTNPMRIQNTGMGHIGHLDCRIGKVKAFFCILATTVVLYLLRKKKGTRIVSPYHNQVAYHYQVGFLSYLDEYWITQQLFANLAEQDLEELSQSNVLI